MSSFASYGQRAGLCALGLTLSMCTSAGTETDNPVLDFEASECSGPRADYESTVARTSAALTLSAQDHGGLYCYAWQANDDGTVGIDVINYRGGCSVTFALAETRVEGDHIDLGIVNAACESGSCDATCLYDFTYELRGVDVSRPAWLQLRELACSDDREDELEPRLELPLDTEPEGILCRQQIHYAGPPACGMARTPPCGGDYFGTCEDGCGDALTCVDDGAFGEDLCFVPCEQDEDCPLEIESCQQGVCQLRETF
jgi:hypothetical protein